MVLCGGALSTRNRIGHVVAMRTYSFLSTSEYCAGRRDKDTLRECYSLLYVYIYNVFNLISSPGGKCLTIANYGDIPLVLEDLALCATTKTKWAGFLHFVAGVQAGYDVKQSRQSYRPCDGLCFLALVLEADSEAVVTGIG